MKIYLISIMYKYKINNISVYTILDKRRRKNNGEFPVKVEVIFKRRQKYYPTGVDATEEEWESMWNAKRIKNKCVLIEKAFNRIRDEIENLAVNDEFTFISLDYRLGRSYETLNGAFEEKMESLMQESRINSFYRYRSTLRNLEAFAGKRIQFSEVNIVWLKRCEELWMKSGKNSTSVNIYMKTLKSIMCDAVKRGYIKESQNPFSSGKYEMPSPKSRKLALNKKQIEALINYKGDNRLEMYRDLWLFSYLCNGINFRDMIFLRYENIIDGEITFVRSKTKHILGESKEIRATYSLKLQEIVSKWGNKNNGNPKSFLFPFARGKESPKDIIRIVREVIYRTNSALQELSSILDIPAFTTYSARHSFATVLKKGGADIRYISECLGHTNVRMTEVYLEGFDCDDRKKYSKILTDFSVSDDIQLSE